MMHRNNWNIWMRWQPRINWNTDKSPEMSCLLRNDELARGKRARRTLEPRERIWSPEKLELNPPEKESDEEWRTRRDSPVETIDERLKRLHTNEIDGRERLGSGKKRVGGRENKGNLEGKTTNILKRKHRLKECKDFTRVGWILDNGLRFREEEGWGGWKRKQPTIEVKDEEARVDLTRNAPDEKSWELTIRQPTAWS